MGDNIEEWYIRPEGEAFDLILYETYTNYFSIKFHYAGRFIDSPNKQYVDCEFACVDMVNNADFRIDLLNSVLCSLGFEDDDVYNLYYEIPLKSLDIGLNPLEHLVDEVEVNMNAFNFQIEGQDEDGLVDPIKPLIIVIEDDLEFLDSLESDQKDKKFYVAVSKTKAFRAKAKAQVHLKGYVKVHYSLLKDYVSELQKCNPDNTVKIDVYREEDPEKTTRMFRRIYVCLGALKRGFKESRRELLGLDEAFMRGGDFKEMLWKCATSTTVVKFEKHMQELKDYNKKAYEWLNKIAHEHWSRAYFSGIPCKHAIDAIHGMADNGMDVGTPEDWVHDSYKLKTWMNVYSHKFNPVNDRDILCKATGHNKRGCKANVSSDGGQKATTVPKKTVGRKRSASQPGNEAATQGSQASAGSTLKAATQGSQASA
uniref:Zinc finger PMZ-type domain-containing protein n=1 Tax=Tanacetum cinerariifolium TaxID=118510 RepID=A0A699GIU4_TANCI|nr:hypothetical protein [Tanacetum cinerariifolium]